MIDDIAEMLKNLTDFLLGLSCGSYRPVTYMQGPNAATCRFGWRGGLVVVRRTCDLVVAGSRPGCDAAAQQP